MTDPGKRQQVPAELKARAETIRGVEYRYSSEWIHKLESQVHWQSYWWQQKLMHDRVRAGDSVLEIGVGSGFTANYLRSKGIDVTTLDIDEEKSPDICANVVTYEFPHIYDHILAFEVFEHIPFEEFQRLLPKVARASRKYLFCSVPLNDKILLRIIVKFWRLRERGLELTRPKRKITAPFHFWEVGANSVPRDLLFRAFASSGLELRESHKAFPHLFCALSSRHASDDD